MKSVNSIIELKILLDHLSERERKAADRYFTRYYSASKEYQLLSGLIVMKNSTKEALDELARTIGYPSVHARPFQKLKSRLKQKLIDFLMSDFSSGSYSSRDAHQGLKIRLKKLNLQACILNGKGFHDKARNLHLTAFRLAEQYQHFDEAVTSLKDYLGEVNELDGSDQYQSLQQKIQKYGFLTQVNETYRSSFKQLLLQIDMRTLDDPFRHLSQFINDISTSSVQHESAACRGMHDFSMALYHLHQGVYDLALRQCLEWISHLQDESQMHERLLRQEFGRLFFEILFLTGKTEVLAMFVSRQIKKFGFGNLDFCFLRCYLHLLLLHPMKTQPGLVLHAMHKPVTDKHQDALIQYYSAHVLYFRGEKKEALSVINASIRSFNTASVQQLDMMVLEIQCMFDLQIDDLIDYRIQSYVKNLAYRKKFQVPEYYFIIYRIFRQILRHKESTVLSNLSDELGRVSVNSILRVRSLQPLFVQNWIGSHFRKSLRKSTQANQMPVG